MELEEVAASEVYGVDIDGASVVIITVVGGVPILVLTVLRALDAKSDHNQPLTKTTPIATTATHMTMSLPLVVIKNY